MKKKESDKKLLLYTVIIAVYAFLIYANTLSNDFVFDDESVVQTNLSIQSLSNIPKFFTGQEGFHKVIGRYYRPVVSTTYTLDYYFWGLNPTGFHLTNILINLFCCLLLFFVLKNLFRNFKTGLEAALFGALIFASHTIHTEAVSWISGRTDSASTLFFFASFLFYIKYDYDSGNVLETDYKHTINFGGKFIYLSLFFYVLGLLSKEMIITVPVIIFLYDFVYQKRKIKEIFRNRIYIYLLFASITLLYLLIRYLVLKDVVEREKYMYFYGKDFAAFIYTMIKTIPVYFKLMIVPVNLLYHYNGTMPYSNSFFETNVILSVIFIIILILISYFLYKKYSIISFAILFFMISLIPVMNIVPSMNFMAERFLYISSFSLSLLSAFLFIKLSKKGKAITIVLVLLILAYSYLTFNRNKDWKNNDTLYSTAEGVNGSVLLVNCGNIYANKKQFDEAASRFRKALEINQNSVLANHNLGLVFLIKGQTDSAEYYIKKGIEADSLAPDGYLQLANIYQNKGDIPSAIMYLEKLQTITPNYRDSKVLLDKLKSFTPSELNKTKLQNNESAVLDQRSYKNYQEGNYESAIKDLEELIKINPSGKAGYLNNIALCNISLKKYSEAEKNYLEAIKSDEKNISYLSGLADLYLKMEKPEKAKDYYNRVLKIDSKNDYSKNKLDSLDKR